jgi:hypothetical protein
MTSRHHVRPRSRKGKSNKLVRLPKGFHRAFHEVFGNLYGQEVVLFTKQLNMLMESKKGISGEDLEALRDHIKLLKLE